MKQILKLKRTLKTAVATGMILLSGNAIIAQQASPSNTQTVITDAAFGPTVIIASNVNAPSSSYGRSKTYSFSQPAIGSLPVTGTVLVNGTPQPNTTITGTAALPTDQTKNLIVKVGVDNDNTYDSTSGTSIVNTAKEWVYLNDAINAFLTLGYRRFIILEGDYFVNGAIVLNNINGSTTEPATGRITIEGEGFGTRIKNATTYTTGNIFEVRSYFNTIKNLSIISNNTNTCLALTPASSTVDPRHNVFENLYIGVQTMVSNDTPVAGRKGISINSSTKQVGFNRFKNITFNSVDTGIELQGSMRLHDNHFENLVFENTIVGVDFVSGVAAYDNIFDNLAIQADSYSKNLVKNISGRHNTFNALNFNDWNSPSLSQSGHSLITVNTNAEHTTIQNSEVGRSAIYLTDNGKYTQLINNYGGNSDITYQLGNNTNPNNTSAISKVEVLGNFVSSMDGATQITADKGRVIIGNTNATLLSEVNSLPSAYKFIVNGKVRVKEEVYVKNAGLTWPDYVFVKDYKLLPLSEVEKHINEKGYLPNMPSAAEVEKDGIAVGDIIKRQQEKIEELTLYLIEQNKKIEEQNKKIEALIQNLKKN